MHIADFTPGYIVEGIIDGLMTLEYEQLILTNRGENILESKQRTKSVRMRQG